MARGLHVQEGKRNEYTYEALMQLIRVDDGQENATWVYTYDQGGNILSKKKYAYGVTTGEPAESKTFTYGNSNWKDQLTAVNGTPITYDAIGNPLNDGTWTYTWQNGRQLASMSKSGTTASFKYNENGLRVQKTVNGVTTDYTLHGNNIVHMKQGSNNLHFFYDASNKPAVVVFNGTAYAYAKNLQGDIIAILDNAGTVVVRYAYDAWGSPISCTGVMSETLGALNPFRYRGYVYDGETKLYYLCSRYYFPFWCRFINPDRIVKGNSCAYCDGNPVSSYDPNGNTAVPVYPYPGVYTVVFNRQEYREFVRHVKETCDDIIRSESEQGRIIGQVVHNEDLNWGIAVIGALIGGPIGKAVSIGGAVLGTLSRFPSVLETTEDVLLGPTEGDKYLGLLSTLTDCQEENENALFFAVHISYGLETSHFVVVPYTYYPYNFRHYNSNPLSFKYRYETSPHHIAYDVVHDIIYEQMGICPTLVSQNDFPINFNPYSY